MLAVCDLGRLAPPFLAHVVSDQKLLPALAVRGDRRAEVLRPVRHVSKDILRPAFGIVGMAFDRARLFGERMDTPRFKLFRLEMRELLYVRAVITHVVAVA